MAVVLVGRIDLERLMRVSKLASIEQRAVSTIIVAMHAWSDLIGRRFAGFAGLPYHSPVSRQLWEELWETEEQS